MIARSSAALAPALAVASALALASCATLSAERVVYVEVDGDNSCLVTIDGRAHALPAETAALARRLRILAGPRASALMSLRPALTRPGCWDEAVAMVRAAGFPRIGFFGEEPERGAGPVGG